MAILALQHRQHHSAATDRVERNSLRALFGNRDGLQCSGCFNRCCRRGIRIMASTDGSIVTGDEDALAIALRNLLNNALRFARTRVVIDVAPANGRVTIAIRDDGPGFTEESRRRAFHRFFRGLEKGRPSEGAGLGLALVLRVAQLHEGSVDIVPGIEGGAGIALHLPLRTPRLTACGQALATRNR